MNTNSFRSLFGLAALASLVGAQGCVADRPSRNGVFDENQYIRKDFLIQNVNGQPDPGWYMKATIVQTSTPNPLAGQFDMFTGAENSGALVRFGITSDKLNLIDMRELTTDPTVAAQNATTPSVVNAWPITNVDLKYYINLDGEKTNQYQENQELDWQVRQWVKLNFDKNDFSDVAGLGPFQSLFLQKCGDVGNASGTLVPGSFQVDTTNDYMQWTIGVSVPLNLNDADCMTAFGSAGRDFLRMNRTAVTMNVMYSMSRAKPVDPTTYTPLEIAEKDSIRHKYGPIEITNYSRDMNSGLLAARQLTVRYNPNKPIVWYFAQGYPTAQEDMWTRKGGIVDQTNAIFAKAGATAKLSVLHFDDNTFNDHAGPKRQYGDVRYNFIRWESDLDTDSPFLAVTQFQPDLRTGELVSASINLADAPLKDFLVQRTAGYISSIDTTDPFADPPPDYSKYTAANPVIGKLSSSCTVGQTLPLFDPVVKLNVYAKSTLYQRMSLYLPKAPDGAATPGPSDFIYTHPGPDGQTFKSAYLTLMPFITYADPHANQFVNPSPLPGEGDDDDSSSLNTLVTTLHNESQFQSAISAYDHGQGLAAVNIGQGQAGMQTAYDAIDSMRQLWKAHDDYRYAWSMHHSLMRGDTTDAISFPQIVARSSRHCVGTTADAAFGSAGHWQSATEWENALIQSYYETIVWHEFGHVLGLEHNFMGSIDSANFPTYVDSTGATQYGKLTSSIMEYSSSYDDTYWNNGNGGSKTATNTAPGWLAYDQGGIGFIYGNNLNAKSAGPKPYPTGSNDVTTGISGQVSATVPWNDPYGFKGTTETNFLRCSEEHLRYTPLCKQFDVGTTPSEIVAADIEAYDWNYKWTNFRNYYKVWDDSNYGTRVANMISESRRFQSLANWDWSNAELTDKLIRIGISPPANAGAVNSGNFYTQLTNEFLADVNSAMQMNAAFHEAIIQQSSGQRSFKTVWDPYFGDVTQQGISLDKEFATTEWLGLWAYDNYDPTQSAGYYGSSMVNGPGLTSPAQAWSTTSSMLGEKGAFDAYPTLFPSAVALFGHDTQSVLFEGLGYTQMRDWIGGHSFMRIEDVLAFFRNIAAQNPNQVNGCANYDTCTYNPMDPQTDATDSGHSSTVHAFVGPDNRRWTWVYLQDRNQYFFVDQDRNPSSYFQVLTYNQALLVAFDDGNPPTTIYNDDINTKFMIDAFGLFGGEDSTAE